MLIRSRFFLYCTKTARCDISTIATSMMTSTLRYARTLTAATTSAVFIERRLVRSMKIQTTFDMIGIHKQGSISKWTDHADTR